VAGKARVHELAKELGKTSKEIMAKLNQMGEFVKSPSSTIEAPVVRKLRDAFPASKPAGKHGAKDQPADCRHEQPVELILAQIEDAEHERRRAGNVDEQSTEIAGDRQRQRQELVRPEDFAITCEQ